MYSMFKSSSQQAPKSVPGNAVELKEKPPIAQTQDTKSVFVGAPKVDNCPAGWDNIPSDTDDKDSNDLKKQAASIKHLIMGAKSGMFGTSSFKELKKGHYQFTLCEGQFTPVAADASAIIGVALSNDDVRGLTDFSVLKAIFDVFRLVEIKMVWTPWGKYTVGYRPSLICCADIDNQVVSTYAYGNLVPSILARGPDGPFGMKVFDGCEVHTRSFKYAKDTIKVPLAGDSSYNLLVTAGAWANCNGGTKILGQINLAGATGAGVSLTYGAMTRFFVVEFAMRRA
jgi:hypothetical protein